MRNLFRKPPQDVSSVPAKVRQAPGPNEQTLLVVCENEHCRERLYVREIETNQKVSHKCEHHARLTAAERISMLLDEGTWREHDQDLRPGDPLAFVSAGQPYREKLIETQERTGLTEAAISGEGAIEGIPFHLIVLDFSFLGASMGCVVGEKVARAADRARESGTALITVSASGGARMHEGIFSLMQMAKTIAALAEMGEARVPHISLLTDPTLGGVPASYAGVGDILVAEQGAVVGFAGRRVIEQGTHQKLPADAQRASFQLEHGMVDMVLHRREIRPTFARLLRFFVANRDPRSVVDGLASGIARG
jgi:acetyl-CoA carboxylase carboxyl transferase subunit beta